MTPLLSSALLRAQSDERLVELAAVGHDRAFEAIVERYRRPLLRYLRRLLSDTLAEDVVQATFINAWSSLRAGTEVRDLRPWLYRIAHNAAINALKKVGEAMEEVPESAGGFATEPATELERRDEMLHALTSIAALPSRQRAALLAVAVDGRAHAEVAEELGLTDGAVRQLVHRARTTLRMAATAVTPVPLLNAVVASAGDSTVARVAEVAAGAGGAGAASVSLKAGAAAVIATGALVTGGPEVADVVHPSAKPTRPGAGSAAPASPSSAAGGGPLSTPAVAPAVDRSGSSSSGSGSRSGQGTSGRNQRRRGKSAGDERSGRSGNSGRSGHSGRRQRAAGSDRSGPGGGARNTVSPNRGSGSSGSGGSGGSNSGSSGSGSGKSGSGDGPAASSRGTTTSASGGHDNDGASGDEGGGTSGSGGEGGGTSGSGGEGGGTSGQSGDDDLVVTAPESHTTTPAPPTTTPAGPQPETSTTDVPPAPSGEPRTTTDDSSGSGSGGG